MSDYIKEGPSKTEMLLSQGEEEEKNRGENDNKNSSNTLNLDAYVQKHSKRFGEGCNNDDNNNNNPKSFIARFLASSRGEGQAY